MILKYFFFSSSALGQPGRHDDIRLCSTEVVARDVAQIHPATMGTLCSSGAELICIVDLEVRPESGMHAHRRFAEFLHVCECEHQLLECFETASEGTPASYATQGPHRAVMSVNLIRPRVSWTRSDVKAGQSDGSD